MVRPDIGDRSTTLIGTNKTMTKSDGKLRGKWFGQKTHLIRSVPRGFVPSRSILLLGPVIEGKDGCARAGAAAQRTRGLDAEWHGQISVIVLPR